MGYRVGVDLGTTFTAAAVADGSGARMVGLGNRALQVPSVLLLQPDGSFLVGEAAERRAAVESDRVVREVKRRLGDTVPLLVAGQPFSPQALMARLLSWVLERVAERQGGPPDEVVLTHPANWGGFKRELFAQVAALAGVERWVACTEPEAAATQYAARAGLSVGARVVVYDLGGGTFDVCVLEKRAVGFAVLGAPDGVEHLGGVDFDEAVFRRVLGSLEGRLAGVDVDDVQVTAGLARLRRDCVEAKEALSADVDTVVPVGLPGVSTSVRLTRGELEELIRPALGETVAATRRALRSAGVEGADLSAVVLVGGSSRIPLVSELLAEQFGVRTAMDTHPKHDIALGAALYRPEATPPAPAEVRWPTRAGSAATPAKPETVDPRPVAQPPPDTEPAAPAAPIRPDEGPAATSAAASRPETGPALAARPAGEADDRRRPLLLLAVGAVAFAAVSSLGLWLLFGGASSPPTDVPPVESPANALAEDQMVLPLRLGGQEDLYVLAQAGAPRRLIDEPQQRTLPAISPDRQFVYFRTGLTPADFTAWVFDVEAEVVRPMLRDPVDDGSRCVGRPSWNPTDPNEVVLVCNVTGSRQRVKLGTVGSDGRIGGLVPVAGLDEVQLRTAAFSRSGEIAVTYEAGALEPGIRLLSDAGTRTLVSESALATVVNPRDGRLVYITEGSLKMVTESGSADGLLCPREVTLDRTGATTCPVTEGTAFEAAPAWSPDGTTLVFLSAAAGSEPSDAKLMTMDLSSTGGSGAAALVTDVDLGTGIGAPAWASR